MQRFIHTCRSTCVIVTLYQDVYFTDSLLILLKGLARCGTQYQWQHRLHGYYILLFKKLHPNCIKNNTTILQTQIM